MAVSKPLPGVPIDPAHSLARGIIAGFFPTSGLNLTPGSANPLVGSAVSVVGSLGGTAALTSASDPAGVVLLNNRAAFAKILTGDFTIAVVHVPASVSGTQVAVGRTGSGDVWLGDNSGVTSFSISGTTATAPSGSAANKINVLMGTRIAGSARAYVNGRGGTAVSAAASVNFSSGLNIGSFAGLGFYYVSRYLLVLVWNRGLSETEAREFAVNPWQLWPDEQQLVFAPVTTFTGTATSSQAQTAAATGLAGNIGTATSSQAQTAAATGLSGYIGTATASQAQTANATGLAGVIGNATSSQAQSATGAGAETYNGNATSSQAQTAEAVGIAGVIGTATTSQAQTSDAIGVAGIVGTATSSQAQTVNGAGNNGQLSVQFGGHIAQPQYIHVPMFARGTGKATCKSKPHVRVLTRALAIGRSKGTCRPLVRQYMAGRAVGASAQVISSMRLQYNETWHAQRARDDQSLLFGF